MAAYIRVEPMATTHGISSRANADGMSQAYGNNHFRYQPDHSYSRQPTSNSQSSSQAHQRPSQAQHQQQQQQQPSRSRAQSTGMNGPTAGGQVPPTALYVRALYDYETDDRTSLNFHQGDTIQVLTQLSSGWWDGVLNGVRGWFPSNYCMVVTGPNDQTIPDTAQAVGGPNAESSAEEEEEEEDTGDEGPNRQRVRRAQVNGTSSTDATEAREQEEASFWIPQATPDGRLFYFNTLTGVSTMEIPMETPTSANETGPRGTNVNMPDQTRPPPEVYASGDLENNEDEYEESASEMDEAAGTRTQRRRNSYTSEGVSPAASQESFGQSPTMQNRGFDDPNLSMNAVAQAPLAMPMGNAATSFTGNPLGHMSGANIPRSYFDEGNSSAPSWNKLVENIDKAVESYRLAINNSDRSEYVRKAEDISDHLRLLLAAASGTTDNHSGNPSIISTNKALYPHFRDMMSRFSKLVLSSHIAAADWPAPDAYSKCLQEAEGVLNGVYGYVEVARTQRGEDIPRLLPGFVLGSNTGGSWQNNGMGTRDSVLATSFMEDEYETYNDTDAPLDSGLLARMDELKRMVVLNIRRLEEHLALRDKLITPARHKQIANLVCQAAGKVVETFRPWIQALESINLSAMGPQSQGPHMADFVVQKQRLYDVIMQFVLACQAVAAPLSDEWAGVKNEPLEGRLNEVSVAVRQLETCISQVGLSLGQIREIMPSADIDTMKEIRESAVSPRHRSDGGTPFEPSSSGPVSRPVRPNLGDMSFPASYSEGLEVPGVDKTRKQNLSKIGRIFGEVPRDIEQQQREQQEPAFLRLDHEGEICYDSKTDPPQLRGGTLTALIEQLTRHDRLDSPFNSTFLLTYNSFTSGAELFEQLVKRFNVQPPRGISEEDFRIWVDRKQKLIRVRVVNILKSWFDNYWMEEDNEASKELLRRVHAFAKDSIATTATPGSAPLIASVERRMKGQDPTIRNIVATTNTPMPQPIMPKNMKKLKFLDIDPLEFARQLTIIESRLYCRIKPAECLNKTWNKKGGPDEPDPAPTVRALILHSNQLTNWVAEMILNQSEVKKRVYVIKHFVTVAEKCRSMNNFSTLTSIISALGTAPIHRLSRTWSQVNSRTMSTLEEMRKLMASTKNFTEYRERLHSANPPCIPFFGVYLTDLTFIEDGMPSIRRTNLINFAKRARTAEVIRDIQQYQAVPYPLRAVTELQDYILNNMQGAGDVHEMYNKSLQIEPREREDEKITRLLSESGFL